MAKKNRNYDPRLYGVSKEEARSWYEEYMSSQNADTLKKQADDAYRAYQEALSKPNTSKNSASVMKTYNDYADKIRRISEFQSYHGSKSVIPNFQQIEQQYSDAFTSYNERRNEFRNQRLKLLNTKKATKQGIRSSNLQSASNQANDYYKQLEQYYNDIKHGYRYAEDVASHYDIDLNKWKSNPTVSDEDAVLSFLANQMQTYKAKTGFNAIQSQRATARRDTALASNYLADNPEASYDEAVYRGQIQYKADAINSGDKDMRSVARDMDGFVDLYDKYRDAKYYRIRNETLDKIKSDPKTSPEYQTAKESLDKLDALADIRESAARATGTAGEIAGVPAEQIASRLREIGLYDQNTPLTLDYIDQIISSVHTDIARSRAVLTANGYDWDKIQEYIQQERNEEKMQSRVEEARQYASESPVAASIQSAGLNLVSGLGYLGSIPQMLSNAFGGIDNYKPIDVNSSYFAATQLTTAIRDQVAQDLNENNPDFQFLTMDTGELYNVGMSMLDNVIQLAVGAGVGKAFGAAGVAAKNATEAVTLSTMGMSAASSEFLNLTNQGAPASQAFKLATLSGAIEIATEKIGLDNLFKVGSSKTIGELFKNMASQAAAEGMEESISEVLNSAADYLIRGNDSEFMQAVEAKVASGMAPEEAYKSALKEVASAMIKSGIGGALSGLGFGVGGTAVGVYSGNTNAAIGADIRQSGNVKSLQEIARDYSIALSENPSDSEIGSAYKAVKKNAPSIAVEQRLQELGDTSSAKTATKAVQGKRLTRTQKTEAEINSAAEQVIQEWNRNDVSWSQKLRDAKEKLSGMRYSDFIGAFAEKMQLAPEYRDELKKSWSDYVKSGRTDLNQADFTIQWLADYAQNKMQQDSQVQQEKNETQDVVSSEQTSATGPEVVVDIPESGIAVYSVAENKISVDGEILNVNDPKVPEDTARAVRILSRISNITTEDVNKILPEVLSADSQTKAARLAKKAFELGKIGDRVAAENLQPQFGITKDQILNIYNAGRENANTSAKTAQNIINQISEDAKGKDTVGEVIIEDSAKNMSEEQAAQVALIRDVYASALGNKWHITKSYTNEKKKRVINVDGEEIVDANGIFLSKSGDIWIDINAKHTSSRQILAAASHEIVHFFNRFSPESFQSLSDFLAEQYASRGMTFEDRIARIADKYGISKEDAHEEFVAESFARMLSDRKLAEMVVELEQKDKTLVQKILDAINKIIEKIESLLKSEKVSIPVGGQLVDSMDVIERARNLFAYAIEHSGKTYKATGGAFITSEEYQTMENMDISTANMIVALEDTAEVIDKKNYQLPDFKAQFVGTEDFLAEFDNSTVDMDRIAKQIQKFTEEGRKSDLIMSFVPSGDYAGSSDSPLRDNIEHDISFDMDTSCPRTFQYQGYKNKIVNQIGRPLTMVESIQLVELMRAYGQMIPCTYCYMENKRTVMDDAYLSFFKYRTDTLSQPAGREKEKMYGRDKKGKLSEQAERTLNRWLQERKEPGFKNYTAFEVYGGYVSAENYVFSELDKMLESNKNAAGMKPEALAKMLFDSSKVENSEKAKRAFSVVRSFCERWKNDIRSGSGHDVAPIESGNYGIDVDLLALHQEALSYAKSSSGSNIVKNYAPYTGQLRKVSADSRKNIIAMGGLRKHSSNDFRIDYVHDYILLFADMVAGGWSGHTYTKNTDYVRIFGKTGDKINMSIAMDTKNGKVVENSFEGMSWKDARELRKAYENAGVMAMVTDDIQLSYALNSDWIDMIIPFHASGLPKSVWYNLRSWFDYTRKQSEKFLTKGEKLKALRDAGVEAKRSMSAAQVTELYEKTFNIKKIYTMPLDSTEFKKMRTQVQKKMDISGMTDEQIREIYNRDFNKRKAPHFLPGESVENGQKIPGHNNDVQTYLRLCKEYGVRPRFYGIKVADGSGKMINVVDHPNYIKLIKETSRTDTPQRPVSFTFAEYDENLKMTPFEYAMQAMEDAARIGGYQNLAEDQYGIVQEFLDEYAGQNKPLGYLTDRAKKYKRVIDKAQDGILGGLYAGVKRQVPGIDSILLDRIVEDSVEMASVKYPDKTKIKGYRAANSLVKNREKMLSSAQKKLSKVQNDPKSTKEDIRNAEKDVALAERRLKNAKTALDKVLYSPVSGIAIERTSKIISDTYEEKLDSVKEQGRQKAQLERQRGNERVAKAIEEGNQKAANVQKKERERADKKISDVEYAKNQKIKKMQDSTNRKKAVSRLESKVKLLGSYLLKNPKEATIFTGMRKPVAEILKAIDLSKSPDTAAGKTKLSAQLRRLSGIYEQIIDQETRFYSSEDAPDPVAVFDLPFIDEMNQFIDEISDIPLYEMTQEQIDRVIKFLDTVISEVRDANKTVVNGRKVEVTTIGRRLHSEIENGKKISATSLKTPIEVFEEMKSPTAMKLFRDILDAENKYGEVIVESKNKMESIYEKYGANDRKKWDWNSTVELTSKSGDTFEITLGQAIYFYALYNREAGKRHIDNGGFVPVSDKKDSGKNKRKHKDQTEAYTIADDQIKEIEEFIGENGKNFAKDVVSYFSNDLAKKGNYVSRLRHGINLFQEKWYCPIFTSSIYREQNFSPLGDPKIENAGPTQQLNPRATSAVNLVDIRSAFSSHVNFMANYYASVLPLKAFESIYNWKDWEKGADSKRTRTLIANKFGKKTESFITDFIRDLNGGIRVDRGDEIGRKLLSLSKQSMTALSASVALQQLTSIVRAYPEISPIYFSPIPEVRISKVWEEMRKYSPFVVLKEMGGMDISSGMKLDEYLFGRGTDSLTKIRSGVDKASFGIPEAMDKYTWVQIWRAVKKEVASKQKLEVGSKEYYEAVNRRFHDVIAKTQVYDSTASKAAIMRSKNTFTQEMTSFMSEPLLTLNTLFRAVNNLKTGKPGKSAAIIFGAIGSQMAANLITALFGVLRGDDDETPFEEQFLSNFIQDSIDSFPLLNIPYVRQAWSIMNGFDVNSMSFEQFSNTWNSLSSFFKNLTADTSEMTEEELEEHYKDRVAKGWDLLLRSLGFAKVPAYNFYRDFKSFSRLGKVFSNDTTVTEQSLKDSVVDGLPKLFDIFGIGENGDDEKLYTAIMIGDSDYAERFLAKYETESEKNSAIRSALKKNDGRVREAADARIEKNFDMYEELVDDMISSGFDEKIVISAIESYLPEEETEESKPKEKARYSDEELTQAALDGDKTTFDSMKNDIMETDIQNGKTETEASDSITSAVVGVLSDLFENGEVSESEVRNILDSYLELDDAKIDKKILDMQTLKQYGISYSDKKQAYWSGELSKSDLKAILLDYDYEEEDAEYQITAYEWERDYPGHNSYTTSAVRDYTEHLTGSSVSIDTYLSARDMYNEKEGDKDENGESIPYSKTVKVFEAWRELNLPADQLTDLAHTFWKPSSNLNKYMWW